MTKDNRRVELSYGRARKLVNEWKRLKHDFQIKGCRGCEGCELQRFFSELDKKVKS